MAKLILNLFFIFSVTQTQAAGLEAKSVKDLISKISQTNFIFKEVGKTFGFETTKSCLYVSNDLIVLKNYCFPKKQYPAQSFTILSPEFGVVYFYQEDLGSIEKHDIALNVFSVDVRQYITDGLTEIKIADVNKLFGLFYNQQPAACWSSNFSFYLQEPEFGCNQKAANAVGLEAWGKETQQITLDPSQWKKIVNDLNNQFRD